MTFLLDHCIWKETESFLMRAGFSCISLRQLGKAEATNGEIIAIAKERDVPFITRDRDFSNLALYPLGSHAGIILLRIAPTSIDAVHSRLIETLNLLSPEQLRGNLLIITSTSYRLHRAES